MATGPGGSAAPSPRDPVSCRAQLDRQFLSCGICFNKYNNPKVLPCLHSFCEQCLLTYIPPESLSVTCPICRQQSIIPQEGVGALQSNVFLRNLLRSEEDKENIAERPSELKDAGATTTLVCANHRDQALDFYCCACETAVCETCTAMEHSTHNTMSSAEAKHEHKDSLKKMLTNAQAQVPHIKDSIALVREVSNTLLENYRNSEARLQDGFAELERLVAERRESVRAGLESRFREKQETLSAQLRSLEALLDSINKCCEFTDSALQNGNETEVLLVRKEMTERLAQLAHMDLQRLPEENEFLAFNDAELKSARKFLKNLGGVETNSAVAFETVATGEGLKRCFVGRQALVNITTKDRLGDLVKVGQSSFTSDVSCNGGDLIIPEILDNQNGTYDLIYTVPEPGVYQLDIKLFGQHIKGSPFKIKGYSESDSSLERSVSTSRLPKTSAVKQRGTKRPSSSVGSNRKSNPIEDDLLLKIGSKGRNKGEFTNPQGVYSNGDKILVADSNNQCVQVYSNLGDFRLRFGTRGRNAGQLQRPTGVAITMNGNYLVADYDNKWVSIFSKEGKYLNKLGTGKLLGPKGVCVDHNGHIIVVDNKASCVFVFQATGKFLHKFGARGNEPHQFAGPHFCAVNADNDIIVSDFHNHQVKVYDSEGNFKFAFGSNGEGNGQFNAPTGVAVDSKGNILVADWGNSRIQVFDAHGSFLSYINTSADPLYGPQGLAITDQGNVVVGDSGNHCFKIYRYLQ